MRLLDRIEVMNGWKDAPHQWWRYILLPFGWANCRPLGWFRLDLFGFSFFWMYELSPEEEKRARSLGKKLLDWVKKHGKRGK